MGALEKSVRGLIALYVTGAISAEALCKNLPDGWTLDEANDSGGAPLALRTLGYLAEYERGDRSEIELRNVLESEASWTITRSTGSASGPLVPMADYEAQVSVGAGTGLQAALG